MHQHRRKRSRLSLARPAIRTIRRSSRLSKESSKRNRWLKSFGSIDRIKARKRQNRCSRRRAEPLKTSVKRYQGCCPCQQGRRSAAIDCSPLAPPTPNLVSFPEENHNQKVNNALNAIPLPRWTAVTASVTLRPVLYVGVASLLSLFESAKYNSLVLRQNSS